MRNNNYLKTIKQIEKIRSKNNVNWMNILRLAFKLDPKNAAKIMKKINYDDKKISNLLNKLSD
tara:strand:- start:840 stop:1028 length:189 start_codon:yes stop_codon:yes gene_type:complete